jgi:glutamate synthase domain-containing protein 2
LQEGLLLVHNTLVGIGLRQRIRIGASGKMITAFDIAKTLAIAADWVNAARGFMFAVVISPILDQLVRLVACRRGPQLANY